MKAGYNAACYGRRNNNGCEWRKNIFFEYHPFEKRGGVNLDGGGIFEKKSGEKPFSLRPAPSSDTRPCPAEGGVGAAIE